MLTDKVFICSEWHERFLWNFRKDVAYDNIKTHKKQGFTLSLEHTFLVKPQRALTPPSLFRVNTFLQNTSKYIYHTLHKGCAIKKIQNIYTNTTDHTVIRTYSSSNNLISFISRVLIGPHLIFCSPTSPTYCSLPQKCTPVRWYKTLDISLLNRQPQKNYLTERWIKTIQNLA